MKKYTDYVYELFYIKMLQGRASYTDRMKKLYGKRVDFEQRDESISAQFQEKCRRRFIRDKKMLPEMLGGLARVLFQ